MARKGNTPHVSGKRLVAGAAIALVVALALVLAVSLVGLPGPKPGASGDDDTGRGGGYPGHDGVQVNPHTVVYDPGESPFTLLASDDGSVTVSSLDGFDADSILSAGVSDAAPNGLLRHMDTNDAQPVDGGYRVPTSQAALTEAIDYCDVSFAVQLTDQGTYEVYDTTDLDANTGAMPTSGGVVQQAYAASTPTRLSTQQAFADEGLSVDKSGALPHMEAGSLAVGSPNLFSYTEDGFDGSAGEVVTMSLRIHDGSVNMKVLNRFSAHVAYDLGKSTNELTIGGGKPVTLFDKSLKPITFAVGPVPVVVTNDVAVDLSLNASVDTELFGAEGTLDKTVGYEYSSITGVRAIQEDASSAPGVTLKTSEPTVGVQMDAQLTARYKALLYDVAGPQVSVGLRNQNAADLKMVSDKYRSDDNAIAITGTDWRFAGDFSTKATVPLEGRFELQVPQNPFDEGDPKKLVDKELFNTGDAITLFDEHKHFEVPDDDDPTSAGADGSLSVPFDEDAFADQGSSEQGNGDSASDADGAEQAGGNTASARTPELRGPVSGSDGIPQEGAAEGVVPALQFDYPADWHVQNDTFGSVGTMGGLSVVSPDGSVAVTLSEKVGANGGAFTGLESFERLAFSGLGNGMTVSLIEGSGMNRIELTDLSNFPNMSDSVLVGDGSVSFILQVNGSSNIDPNDVESRAYQQAIAIIASLRVAE